MSFLLSPARHKDVDFILSLIMNGARKGHFNLQAISDKGLMRSDLLSIINSGLDRNMLASVAYVAWNDGKRVGMASMTATTKPDGGFELGAIAVKPSDQNKGFGSLILETLLQKWLLKKTIYARCYPKSEKLFLMLQKKGFEFLGFSGEDRILRHEKVNGIDLGLRVGSIIPTRHSS
jgi:GNAT superfamily N-acetyltransferase